jgi:hypothetical protein
MPRLRWTAALCAAAVMVIAGVASAAAAPARHGASGAEHAAVTAQVDGSTYVLLGPSVFGVTVQQDPLAYHAVKLADGTVRGWWRYDSWQAGPVTCLSVSGNRAWAGGPITASSDPTQLGMGAWWQAADNGTGRHPVIPDRTTFTGIGTMAQIIAYCNDQPAPHFIFDVQLGGVSAEDQSGTR